jgi:hypothetical protein
MSYKQTIDALNALYNLDQVARQGRKFTCLWGKLDLVQVEVDENYYNALVDCFARKLYPDTDNKK